MWMALLPMLFFLVLTPALLLSQEIMREQAEMQAAQLATMMEMQQHAAMLYCVKTKDCNRVRALAVADILPYFEAPMRGGSAWQSTGGGDFFHSYSDVTGRVMTILPASTRRLRGQMEPGMLRKSWEDRGVSGAGLYQSSTDNIIDINGKVISLSTFVVTIGAGDPVIVELR